MDSGIEDQLGALVDDPHFSLLIERRSTFNLFEALGAVRGEVRHSNFLAFLLDPSSNHGLGAEPLKRFLRLVLGPMEPGQRPLSTLEVIVGDLDNALIAREEANIDLLIRVKEINLVVLIENKIGAKAGDGQLKRYRQHVEKEFVGWRKLLLFLTPDGDDPDEDGYQALDYSELAKMISGLVDNAPTSAAQIAIRHYVEMLRKYIVPDQELNELARQLYNRHKAAFDFVFTAMPKPQGLFAIAKSLRDGAEQMVPDTDTSVIVRFVPQSWATVSALMKCPSKEWTKTGRHVLFEIKTFNTSYTDRVNLSLIVGPAPESDRLKLWAAARDRGFKGLVKPMGGKWATIWSRDLLTQTAGATMDVDAKREAIEAAWAIFLENDLPSLEAEILDIVSVKSS